MPPSTEGARKSADRKSPAGRAAGKRISQLGDFKLIKKLGRGGMGVVYLAKQVSLDRLVALKTLSRELAEDPKFVERFLREARTMARLQHPNIVQVYAAESRSGIHYAAIEYIDGRSMQRWMNRLGRLSLADALYVVLTCAQALGHAHDQGMIHRDVKPDNILVTGRGVVKVADFGLAKALDEDLTLTASGAGLGTPLYMAPEQARNAKHVDRRSDIYALGTTLYYFVTGELPFAGETTIELITAKERGRFTPARRLNPEVPERLDLMIDKMLAKTPAHRYGDCGEIIRDLKSLDLAGVSLSFIDAGEKAADEASRTPAAGMPGDTATVAGHSAAHAARTQSGRGTVRIDEPAAEKIWFVRHHDARGRVHMTKMTTAQVRRGIKTGSLDFKAQAKASREDELLPLAQFPEFSGEVESRLIQARAESRSAGLKEQYERIDRAERRRRRWGWLRRWTENFKGLIGLALWLALVVAVIYAGWKWGWPWVQEMLGEW